jgi:hypothetical protein
MRRLHALLWVCAARGRCSLVFSVVLATTGSASAAITVTYIQPTADIDRERSYAVELLRLSLARSGGDYQLQPTFEPIPQSRAIRLLQAGRELDVLWTVTSPERERGLLPIRIPIDRGIYGWRLFLIREDAQPRFDAVASLADLALLEAGQGHDWPDVAILRHSGLQVGTGSSYDGLFGMLARGRIDYFPRALPEVWAELQLRRQLPLRVESTLAVHYPSAVYFFVSPKNPELAAAIQRGLERADADGSFLALFDEFFGASIRAAKLSTRRVFDIANPLLPQLVQTTDPRYWFTPETTEEPLRARLP